MIKLKVATQQLCNVLGKKKRDVFWHSQLFVVGCLCRSRLLARNTAIGDRGVVGILPIRKFHPSSITDTDRCCSLKLWLCGGATTCGLD